MPQNPHITHRPKFMQRYISLVILLAALGFVACTQEEKQIPSPEIFLGDAEGGLEIEVGDTVILEPKITYNYESRYEWRIDNETIDYKGIALQIIAAGLGRTEYFFKVTTPSGSDSVFIPVDVMVMVDFQDLKLSDNDYWTPDTENNSFSNNQVRFPSEMINDTTWQGFGYSRLFSKASTEPFEPYSAYAIDGEDEIFALVSHPPGSSAATLIFSDEENHHLKTLTIANTNQGFNLMKFGTDELERLGGPAGTTPDWCKVTITGVDKDGVTTGEKSFFLGDFRFDNNKRDYITDEWQTVDLTELGAVNQLLFTVEVSRESLMVRPERFCIDNIKVLD